MKTTTNLLTLPAALLLQYLTTPTSAYYITTGYGFGIDPVLNSSSLPSTSNDTSTSDLPSLYTSAPNQTAVPFVLGTGGFFNLRVGVSAVDLAGAEGLGLREPTGVFSLYSLTWEGGDEVSLHDSVSAAEENTDNPRLCATFYGGLFSASATNAYEGNGDCSGPLGQKCMDALQEARFGGNVDMCRQPSLPDECRDKVPEGSIYISSLLTNETQLSPAPIAYNHVVAEANSPDATDALIQETQKVHFVLFSDQNSYRPVCVRVTNEKAQKGEPAVSGAASATVVASWSLGAIVGVAVAFSAL